MRALKNKTAKQQLRPLLRGQNRAGLGGKNKQVKEWNDATANDCAIVTYSPRGDILRFSPTTSRHMPGCCHAAHNTTRQLNISMSRKIIRMQIFHLILYSTTTTYLYDTGMPLPRKPLTS